MGLVSGGLQDEQFFDAPPAVVWMAVKSGVESTKYFKKVRDLNNLTMRIVYASKLGGPDATLSVRPTPGGGSIVSLELRTSAMGRFGSMGVARNQQIQIEMNFPHHRNAVFEAIAAALQSIARDGDGGEAASSPPPNALLDIDSHDRPEPPDSSRSVVDSLKELTDLHLAGLLSDEEFQAAKAKLLS